MTTRCLRGERCEAKVRCDQGELHGAPADRPLCDTCERAVKTALDVVPRLFVDLENALPPGSTRPSGGQRPKVTGSPLGVAGRPLHLQESVHQLLTVWEDAVRDLAGLSPVVRRDEDPWERTKRRARASVETAAAAKLLGAHLTAWLVHGPIEYAVTSSTADPDDPKAQPSDEPIYVTQCGWEAAVALLDWKGRARSTLGVTKAITVRDEPCMYCEARTIVEEAGDDAIRCATCNRSWPREEYHARVRGFEPYLRKLAKEGKVKRA